MVKLKIGTGSAKKDTPKPKEKDFADDYTDEELAEMNEEIEKEQNNDAKTMPDDLKVEFFNFNKDILDMWYETYPNKNIIYHGSLTKQFIEFYLQECHSLCQLKQVNPELLTEEQKQMFVDTIEMVSAVNDVNEGLIADDVKGEGFYSYGEGNEIIINPTDEQQGLYEFILNEKWDEKEKGIYEFDMILREYIISKKPKSLTDALNYLLKKFNLEKKYEKTSTTPKNEKKYLKPNDISNGIKSYHYLGDLYDLLDDETLFETKRDFTEEELNKIKEITTFLRR